MISTDEVKRIAKLSRLEFNQSELENIQNDLNGIVNYVNQLQGVDTSNLNTELNCVDAQTNLRPDQPKNYFTQQEAVQNAPSKKAGAFFVPIVME